MEPIDVIFGVILTALGIGGCCVFIWEGLKSFLNARQELKDARAELVAARVRLHLAGYGLTNEQVEGAMLTMDELMYYRGEDLCVRRRDPDGQYRTIYPELGYCISSAGVERWSPPEEAPQPQPAPEEAPCGTAGRS